MVLATLMLCNYSSRMALRSLLIVMFKALTTSKLFFCVCSVGGAPTALGRCNILAVSRWHDLAAIESQYVKPIQSNSPCHLARTIEITWPCRNLVCHFESAFWFPTEMIQNHRNRITFIFSSALETKFAKASMPILESELQSSLSIEVTWQKWVFLFLKSILGKDIVFPKIASFFQILRLHQAFLAECK